MFRTITAAVFGITALAACSQPLPATGKSDLQPVALLSDKQAAILKDVRYICEMVPKTYVYFGPRKASWPKACAEAETRIAAADTPAQRLGVLEGLVDALHDPHVSLNTNSDQSPLLVPTGADYWIEDNRVTAVRVGGDAAAAGLRVGDEVVAVNGLPLLKAAAQRIRPAGLMASEAQENWAIVAAAAGFRGEARSVTVVRSDTEMKIDIPPVPNLDDPLIVDARTIDSVGYIKINNALGDRGAVQAVDDALDRLKGSTGWILDLRNTPGGGGTDVAEPIMGRFITEAAPYQLIRPMDEAAWQKRAAPRGPWTATGPLVVLVGRWTGSMGEGMAVGFDGMGRGHVIGSDMARLAGGVDGFDLPATGISINLPTYDLAHLDGTPRHEWSPSQQVVADNGDGPDLALQAALDWLGTQD